MKNFQGKMNVLKELDFQTLKSRIADQMIEQYDIEPTVAENFLLSAWAKKTIERDIIWAQLMGEKYWAEEFFEILKFDLKDEMEKKSTDW